MQKKERRKYTMLPRVLKIVKWLMFGNYDYKAKLISFLEILMKEGKNIEIVGSKKGEITVRFRKEF